MVDAKPASPPVKKKFSRATGILMGKTGTGKTSALATAFQKYPVLLTRRNNLEGFESIMADLDPKLKLPRKKDVPGGNAWAWFSQHRRMVARCMRKRQTSADRKVRRTLAGEVAPNWTISENEPVPGLVISEFSSLLTMVHDWREKKFPSEGWKSFNHVKNEALAYIDIFDKYGLGLWLEMHIQEVDPNKEGSARGPKSPGIKMKHDLVEAVRNVWELVYDYDYDDDTADDGDEDQPERRLVLTRPSADTDRKSRIKVPPRLDLSKHTMAYYIRKAGLPVN